MEDLVAFIIHKTSSYTEIILFLPVHTSAKSLRFVKSLRVRITKKCLEKIKRLFLRNTVLFVLDKQLNRGYMQPFFC